LRWTLYAIATACFAGFPALISALMFFRNAPFEADFTSGMLLALLDALHGGQSTVARQRPLGRFG
jgi:hypothetical protein